MKAIVLVGGYATRLFPISLRTPKALLPVGGEPVVSVIIGKLAQAGVKDVIVSLATSQKMIEKALGHSVGSASVHYSYEESRRDDEKPGAIGAILQVANKFGADDYVIVGGDNFFDGLDLKKVIDYRKETGAPAVIVFHELSDKSLVSLYGIGALDKENRIVKFQEKPKAEEAVSTLASTAVYLVSKEFVEKKLPAYVKEKHKMGERPDRLGDIWQYYLKKIDLRGYPYQGSWGDLNTCQSYIDLNKTVMKVEKKSRVDGKIGEGARIIEPVIIEKGVVVGKKAVVGPYTHLAEGTVVGEGASVVGSVVFEKVKIGSGAVVKDSLVDGHSVIGDGAHVDSYSMIGYGAVIGKNARVLSGSAIWPFVEVGEGAFVEGKVDVPEEFFKPRLEKAGFWKK